MCHEVYFTCTVGFIGMNMQPWQARCTGMLKKFCLPWPSSYWYHTINVGCTVSHSSSCSRLEAVQIFYWWQWQCQSCSLYENTRSVLPGFAACSLLPLSAWWFWSGENRCRILLWCIQGDSLNIPAVSVWLDLFNKLTYSSSSSS